MDYGYVAGNEHDQKLELFRKGFEEIIGNTNA